jgi:hypothetical protein
MKVPHAENVREGGDSQEHPALSEERSPLGVRSYCWNFIHEKAQSYSDGGGEWTCPGCLGRRCRTLEHALEPEGR